MNCSSAETLFERLLENELPAVQSVAVRAHLERCVTCRGVFDELRVVDALLVRPRRIDLAPNFTFAMMAEARALPPPAPYRAPVRAYLVSYLAAAWLAIGAAMLLAPHLMHALGGTVLDLARSIADAIGGLGTVVARLFGHDGNTLTAVLGALLVLDALLVAALALALRYVRPRLVERLRS